LGNGRLSILRTVSVRRAGGTFAMGCPTTPIAPGLRARTAQRAVPTMNHRAYSARNFCDTTSDDTRCARYTGADRGGSTTCQARGPYHESPPVTRAELLRWDVRRRSLRPLYGRGRRSAASLPKTVRSLPLTCR
jgi:hypothetical protein